jgi:hypothetical protein
MSLYPVAGCKLYIGGVLSDKATDFVEADFTSQTWVEIDGWEQMGSFGDTAQVITTSLINRGRDVKQKGTRNAGQMQNVFAINAADAGQIALIAAEKTSNNYAFKVELNDKPAGVGATPSMRYFIGLVTSAQEAGGEANTVQKLNATIEINSNIVPVAATTGDED